MAAVTSCENTLLKMITMMVRKITVKDDHDNEECMLLLS